MIVIYRKSDLVRTGTVEGSMTSEQEIELNVIPNFGGVPDDYSYIETDEKLFHLELIDGVVTAVKNALQLADVQQAKISQITDFYNQKLTAGFSSSATGIAHIFGYGQTDTLKFMQLAILVLSGMVVWPYKIRNKDGVDVPHTQAQYQALLIDIATFAQAQNVLEGEYFDRVNACTSIDDVNKIIVQF